MKNVALLRTGMLVLPLFISAILLLMGWATARAAHEVQKPHVVDQAGVLSADTRRTVEAEASELQQRRGIVFVLLAQGARPWPTDEVAARVTESPNLSGFQLETGFYEPTLVLQVSQGESSRQMSRGMQFSRNLWYNAPALFSYEDWGKDLDELAVWASRDLMKRAESGVHRYSFSERRAQVRLTVGVVMSVLMAVICVTILAVFVQGSQRGSKIGRLLDIPVLLLGPPSLILLSAYVLGWPEGYRAAFFALGLGAFAIITIQIVRSCIAKRWLPLFAMLVVATWVYFAIALYTRSIGSTSNDVKRYFLEQLLTSLSFTAKYFLLMSVIAALAFVSLRLVGLTADEWRTGLNHVLRALRGWRPLADDNQEEANFWEWIRFYGALMLPLRVIELSLVAIRLHLIVLQIRLGSKRPVFDFTSNRMKAVTAALVLCPERDRASSPAARASWLEKEIAARLEALTPREASVSLLTEILTLREQSLNKDARELAVT